MNLDLILITEDINFGQLRDKKVSPVAVYKDQMEKWLFEPIRYLSNMHLNHDKIRFSHGYSVFALELLFFEPHGQYLVGDISDGSKKTFNKGFNRFIDFLLEKKYLSKETKDRIDSMDFYNITRCGIYHSLTIKSKVLIDSRKGVSKNVFENSHLGGIFVYPWNFILALEEYFASYTCELEQQEPNELKENFQKTFDILFSIDENIQ